MQRCCLPSLLHWQSSDGKHRTVAPGTAAGEYTRRHCAPALHHNIVGVESRQLHPTLLSPPFVRGARLCLYGGPHAGPCANAPVPVKCVPGLGTPRSHCLPAARRAMRQGSHYLWAYTHESLTQAWHARSKPAACVTQARTASAWPVQQLRLPTQNGALCMVPDGGTHVGAAVSRHLGRQEPQPVRLLEAVK